MTPQMKPIRSFLFVPGNKESMLDKAANARADALILDLEDSVPPTEKLAARALVARKIPELIAQGQRIWVRINRTAHIYDLDDIVAIAQPGVEGIFISKPWGPEDVHMAACMLAEAETRANLPLGSLRLIPLLETARSLQLAFEIAQHERVPAIVGATAKNADVGRALKYVWTAEGRESEYMKSRVVMAARAAGKQPIGGIWQQIKDLEDEPGDDVFVRRGKRLTGLTPPGETMLPIVERLLLEAENLRRAGDEFTAAERGGLVVAATHSQARYALPQVVRDFRQHYPQVSLHLRQGSPRQVAEMLLSGEADIGVATEALAGYERLVTLPCYRWSHSIVVPPGHALLQGSGPVTLQALARDRKSVV